MLSAYFFSSPPSDPESSSMTMTSPLDLDEVSAGETTFLILDGLLNVQNNKRHKIP